MSSSISFNFKGRGKLRVYLIWNIRVGLNLYAEKQQIASSFFSFVPMGNGILDYTI